MKHEYLEYQSYIHAYLQLAIVTTNNATYVTYTLVTIFSTRISCFIFY